MLKLKSKYTDDYNNAFSIKENSFKRAYGTAAGPDGTPTNF